MKKIIILLLTTISFAQKNNAEEYTLFTIKNTVHYQNVKSDAQELLDNLANKIKNDTKEVASELIDQLNVTKDDAFQQVNCTIEDKIIAPATNGAKKAGIAIGIGAAVITATAGILYLIKK